MYMHISKKNQRNIKKTKILEIIYYKITLFIIYLMY